MKVFEYLKFKSSVNFTYTSKEVSPNVKVFVTCKMITEALY